MATRYNVLDYGLKADGQTKNPTDNTKALEDLIAKVPNGSVIFFPCGTYGIASGISISKDILFIGENEEMQTAGTSPNRIHDPISVIKYIGNKNNVTIFRRSGYHDVSFVRLTLDGGNSYTVKKNTSTKSGISYQYLISTTSKENINGLDLSEQAPGIVKNCMFWGFSGYGVKVHMHSYVEGCGFYMCKRGIITAFTDTMLHNLWFCKSGTAIYLSNTDIERHATSVNVSDTWADQLTEHFIESDPSVTSVGIIASNIWLDHIQMSAFYLPNAFLGGSRISGTFGRVGMNYAGLKDEDRTADIAAESDFFYTGRYVIHSSFELNIGTVEGKGQNIGECFSRLFTTRETGSKNNKVTCSKFPIARLYDTRTSTPWNFFSYFGSDGAIERSGSLDYINGVHYHNNSPSSSTWSPAVGYLYYNYLKHILYRCSAINVSNNTYSFVWEELQRGTQFETLPTPGLNVVGLVAQYVGMTNNKYTHGYFYECVDNGVTREWVRVDVQPDKLDVLKGIASTSSDFEDFKTRISDL